MRKTGILLWLGLGILGCGGRAADWDSTPKDVQALGLSGSVAVLDPALHRLLMLTSPSGLELQTAEINVGINPSIIQADAKRERLFVLSRGVQPRRNQGDEWPSFTVIDGTTTPRVLARYELGQNSPPGALAVDPEGAWAVLYQPSQGTAQSGILSNPNELILLRLPPADAAVAIDTTQVDYRPRTLTLDSIASQPKALIFTPTLELSGDLGVEPHRLLVVRTDHEVVLVDLSDPNLTRQTTIVAPDAANGQTGTPEEVIVYPQSVTIGAVATGEQAATTSTQQGLLGLRLANDSSVVTYHFRIANDRIFPVPNVVALEGVPSDIEFVQVAAGQQPMLAALVSRSGASGGSFATLINTETAAPSRVGLADAYSHLELVTKQVTTTSELGTDKALLWGEAASSIGFWSLESVAGTPYRSVDTYSLPFKATAVTSVVRDSSDPDPTRDYSYLKLVEAGQQKTFYVVNLRDPAAPPIQVYQSEFELVVSPDGERAWAFIPGSLELGKLDFEDLHATSLTLERAIQTVADIVQPGPAVAVGDGTNSAPPRVLVALHKVDVAGRTELGATVLDVRSPDAANTKFYSELLLEGLP